MDKIRITEVLGEIEKFLPDERLAGIERNGVLTENRHRYDQFEKAGLCYKAFGDYWIDEAAALAVARYSTKINFSKLYSIPTLDVKEKILNDLVTFNASCRGFLEIQTLGRHLVAIDESVIFTVPLQFFIFRMSHWDDDPDSLLYVGSAEFINSIPDL